MAEALVILRFLNSAALMAAFGAAAFSSYAAAPAPAGVVRRAALVALVAGIATVPCIAAGMAGEDAAAFDPGMLGAALFETEFGHVWCVHLGLLILLAAIPRGMLGAALSFAALASLGWVGHAAGHGLEVNQAVHLVAAGAWLGGLWPLALLLRQARRDGMALAQLRQVLPRFSRMGYAAVALILASGIVNTVSLVGSARAFSDTAYGRLLALKLVLVAAMVALAALNRLRLVPRLARERAALAPLTRAVLAELGLGLAVLAAVAVLGTWPPAAG
jgi:putative copper resistance protein D